MNPWRGLKGLSADVWVIFATTLVNRAGTMVLPFLVLYLVQRLGQPPSLAAFALTIYGFGALISAPIAGRLSDRLGALRVMQGSLLFSGGLLLVFPLLRALPLVFGLTLVWAVIAEAVRPASLAALTTRTPAEQRQAAFALNRLAINLGMSVGPAVGGFLAMAAFPLLFVVDGLTSVAAALLLTVFLSRRSVPWRTETLQTALPRKAGIVENRQMLAFLVALFLVGAMLFQMDAALPLFLVRDLHLPPSFVGLLFMVNTLIIIALEVPLNLATMGSARRGVLILGALLMAASFGALAFATGSASVILAVVIWTFGEMLFFPVSTTYVADFAPDDRRGAYMGAYSLVFGLAHMLGPWTGTLFMERPRCGPWSARVGSARPRSSAWLPGP
jgi:predicted MFS family arabinose efflux permease